MAPHSVGRSQLTAWRESAPTNFYENSRKLDELLVQRVDSQKLLSLRDRLSNFGLTVASVIDPAVTRGESHRDLPRLNRYDGVGNRIDVVEFHPDREVAMAAVWDSGLLSSHLDAGAFERASLFYLLSHVGEGGVACPAVCTIGLGRALEGRGSHELRARYLAGLQSEGFDGHLLGSQFLTEVQGGSDVGANEMVATPDDHEPGAWRLSGEKWFCSVADADLFAVTARPSGAVSGTPGLGCFLVPRSLDGVAPNGFSIRQLKDKLGTRELASGEIDFHDAVAWPIGAIDDGFKVAVQYLLNTSRWLNALGSTGLMRRAYLEAARFCAHRSAFGQRVGEIAIVREQLALMKVEEHAALSSTMMLTSLIDTIEGQRADDTTVLLHRFLVNANKFVTSMTATDVVHQGIELLGGNGTIESFSVLPRLYRDAIVYESWEGTHNVLCAQIHRDAQRLSTLEPVIEWLHVELSRSSKLDLDLALARLTFLETRMRRTLIDAEAGGLQFRRYVGELTRLVQTATLTHRSESASQESLAVAELFLRHHFSNNEGVDRDLVDRVLGPDVA
jgi:alkylation response protein AidB-like acyl-CoA dehydrogenase